MYKLKVRDNGLKERKTRTNWKIVEGLVDRNEDYIRITYGKDPDPITLISRGKGNSFKIQFMLSKDTSDKKVQAILEEVQREIKFYLVEKGEENPWAYAIFHCGTAANVYSKVHWFYYRKGNYVP